MELSSVANGWVESYLDALLTTGLSAEHIKDQNLPSKNDVADADRQIAAKYYVQQILGRGEESISQAWHKVGRNAPGSGAQADKDFRLEYLSWRVWGMKRKHAMVKKELDAANERESAELQEQRTETSVLSSFTDDDEYLREYAKLVPNKLRTQVSETQRTELSESSEDTSPVSTPDSPADAAGSFVDPQLTSDRVPKLYMVLISLHGLVRGEHMELGKDPDTGGQVKYVVEFAKALSRHPAVHRVDLLTRLIRDPKVDKSYGEVEEVLAHSDADGKLGGAYIVRVPCGPQETYLRKEALWPYTREFADNAITYIKSRQLDLVRAYEGCELYSIHGHYADAGECAALISHTLGVPMLLTGHSLGRNKLEHLLKSGTVNRAEIEETYAISRRIEGEERALDASMMVFTSTKQEIKDQWGLYDGYDEQLQRMFHSRHRRGRHVPRMCVIPPGLDFSNLKVDSPPDAFTQLEEAAAQKAALKEAGAAKAVSHSNSMNDVQAGQHADQDVSAGKLPSSTSLTESRSLRAPAGMSVKVPRPPSTAVSAANTPRTPANGSPKTLDKYLAMDPPIWQDIFRFLRNPRKPVVLAMSRPDAKKNITTLVKAFGSNKLLREIANLVLIMGNRDVIDSMAPGSQKVMDQVLKLIDYYNLYGSVAYPKRHTQNDISDIYLLPAATHGVFVNIALQEPFGLTLIEAAAHGVPIVATTNGGPVDIIQTLKNGILVEPTNVEAVADALLQVLTHSSVWEQYSRNGVHNINAYSWPSHCIKVLQQVEKEKKHSNSRIKIAVRATMSACLDDSGLQLHSDHSVAYANGAPLNDSASAAGGLEDSIVSPRAVEALRAMSADLGRQSVPTFRLRHEAPGHVNGMKVIKDKYLVYNLDSVDTADTLRSLLSKKAQKAFLGLTSDGVALGMGINSLYTLAQTDKIIKDAGLSLTDLDFVICNAGAEVWYNASAAQSNTANSQGAVSDEMYDSHVSLHWDKDSVKRVIAQCLNSRSIFGKALSAGTKPAKAATATATACKGQQPPQPPADEDGLEPLTVDHGVARGKDGKFKLHVDTDTGAHHLGVSWIHTSGAISTADQLALLGRIQRKLRKSGLRTHLTLSVETARGGAEGAAEGAPLVKLHVTPLRASRALALRWLAHRHGFDLATSVIVVASASKMDKNIVGIAASDAEEVMGGSHGVLVVPSKAVKGGSGGVVDGTAPAEEGFPGFTIDSDLFTHDKRLQVYSQLS